jgi:hypothetical protein
LKQKRILIKVHVATGAPKAMNDGGPNRSSSDEQQSGQRPEQRKSQRIKVRVPVELFVPGNNVPLRGATSDLSESGCYVESIFPFPVGTIFEMSLQIAETILALGTVVTCHPQVGNGIKFTKMLPEDQEQLRAYLQAAQQEE